MSEEVEDGGPPDPRVVGVDSEDADSLIGALSSGTARDILACLDDEVGTPSEIAERLDTSIQNVRYHLEGLEDAGLVDVADTRYSAKGREMKVYDVASGPVVVFPGRTGDAGRVRRALMDLLAGVAVVGAGAVAIQRVWTTLAAPSGGPTPTFAGGGDGGDAGAFDAAANGTEDGAAAGSDVGIQAAPDAAPRSNDTAEAGAEAADGLVQLVELIGEPGVAFLLGGLLALGIAAVLRYRWGD